MADNEMIAAMLAAGLLVGRANSSARHTAEQLTVETYQRVLPALMLLRHLGGHRPAKKSRIGFLDRPPHHG